MRTMMAALGGVLTEQGRVDVNAFARELDVTLPRLARALGKSPQFLREYPTAPSVQPRALFLVDRVNAIANAVGGLKYAIAWLKTPTPELGGDSAMDLMSSGNNRSFDVAIGYIDSWLMMTPD